MRDLLQRHQNTTVFFAPDVAFADAEKYLLLIFEARALDWTVGASVLTMVSRLVRPVEADAYQAFESEAKSRRHRGIDILKTP